METAPAKPLINTAEAFKMMPGKGKGMFQKLIRARWLAPAFPGSRPIYRTADVEECLRRLEGGEEPRPVHIWRTGHSLDGRAIAHLIPAAGSPRPVCGFRGELFASLPAERQCTNCIAAGKTLRVESA